MKKRWITALAALSLMAAVGAYAEDGGALPGARVEPDTVINTPAARPAETEDDVQDDVQDEEVPVELEPQAPPEPEKAPESAQPRGGLEITEEYRWFISQYNHIRGRTVRYYDNVYAYNHGDYGLTPFDSHVAEEYLTVDATGTYAVAPLVLDITDAMRTALYGGDVGEVSMLYGQYCERRGDGHGRTGFTGVHEGIDFTHEPEAPLYAILGGEVTRAGDSNGTVGVYNAEYDVTLLYLHCEEIEVRRGDMITAGTQIGQEGKKGSGGTYTHIEMRKGRHTSSNPYRNTILESDCPYALMQTALNVVESGRQPVTAAAVMEAQRMREEAEAAARAAEEAARLAEEAENEEPEVELIDVLPSADKGYGFGEATAAPSAAPTKEPEATLPPSTK